MKARNSVNHGRIRKRHPEANKDEKQKTRKESPESTSSDLKYTGNRKSKRAARFRMIRLKPAKEVILTPAPGWEKAEGRPVQREENDIAEVEVRFRGRPNAEDAEPEAREIEPEVIEV